MKNKFYKIIIIIIIFCNISYSARGAEFSETSFLIAEINSSNLSNTRLWDFIQSTGYTGIELNAVQKGENVYLTGSSRNFSVIINRLKNIYDHNTLKITPVFINYKGDISILDSIIGNSSISSSIFYLPIGEAWPSLKYLLDSDRRIIFFISGDSRTPGRVLHQRENYILYQSASGINSEKNFQTKNNCLNLELMMIDNFNDLPVDAPDGSQNQNLVPDYINFLLGKWAHFGKRPNFIFVGNDILKLSFIISQLKSFTYIKGTVMASEKVLEKVYWRNPETNFTGGRFSFPYRGGEELTLSPFVPGYKIIPEQIIVTGEMEVPENYNIMAVPLKLSENLTASFKFNGSVNNVLSPSDDFPGKNFSFSQDIERGTLLKLPENSSINLGSPDKYGLRNSSFSVSCFVKFNEILEFGDNAVLGNYENEYRRGLHLILRSGHPYFGLWSNDYVSKEKLEPNVWYHLVWRYMVETGQQAIFLNGKNIGSSDGHPPFLGTGDIHLGSALSQGASLRGYIDDLHFWDRPLGTEEINRLVLNEDIFFDTAGEYPVNFAKYGYIIIIAISLITGSILLFLLLRHKKNTSVNPANIPAAAKKNITNQINLFGGFKAIDKDGNDITSLFTPKIKELFLFTLFMSLKNETGASVREVNECLWPGLPVKKVNNNRSVTLNKLRKILNYIYGIEIITSNGFLRTEFKEPFFCDYIEAYKLCRLSNGLNKKQLETFFMLVNNGRFLKDTDWDWLDETLGFVGNQVIDNLLKLASVYKDENNFSKTDSIAKRILEYDDLNEEAVWLQIWALLQTKNDYLAKFHFGSFVTKYEESLGETFPMDYDRFVTHYSYIL
jgi:two-component SAPR family response regulator